MSKKVTGQHLSAWSRRLVYPFQVGNDHRYGTCTTPGTAYFFQRTRIASGARKPPTHCFAFTVYGDLGGLISVTFLCAPQRIEDLDIPIWQDGSLFLGGWRSEENTKNPRRSMESMYRWTFGLLLQGQCCNSRQKTMKPTATNRNAMECHGMPMLQIAPSL